MTENTIYSRLYLIIMKKPQSWHQNKRTDPRHWHTHNHHTGVVQWAELVNDWSMWPCEWAVDGGVRRRHPQAAANIIMQTSRVFVFFCVGGWVGAGEGMDLTAPTRTGPGRPKSIRLWMRLMRSTLSVFHSVSALLRLSDSRAATELNFLFCQWSLVRWASFIRLYDSWLTAALPRI